MLNLRKMLSAWNSTERNNINKNWTDIEYGFSSFDKKVNETYSAADSAKKSAENAINTSNAARDIANKAKVTADATSRQVNEIINESGNTNAEVIAAHTDTQTLETFLTIGERLDSISARQPYVHPIVQDLIGKRKIMAHRCAYFRLPENTLSGFYEAARMGIKYFETDFHRTLDGHHVCIHDLSTARTSDTSLIIANSTLEEVMKVKQNKLAKSSFYDNPTIPILDDVLEFMRVTGACVNLNFDYGITDENIPGVIQKFYEYNVQEQVIVSPRFLEFDNTLCTTQQVELSDAGFAAARKAGNVIPAYDYGYGGWDYLGRTQRAMALASKHNLPLLLWTVTNYDVFLALDKINVNLMMVDDLWLRKDDIK